MSTKNYTDGECPRNWISLEEFEQRRDLAAGRVTDNRGNTPRAWVNMNTNRVVYQESPFSSKIHVGEIDKSDYTIDRLWSYEVVDYINSSNLSDDIVSAAFEYMRNDNGMTPIGRFFRKR